MKPLEALRALGTGGEAPVAAKHRVQAALIASLGAAVGGTVATAGAASAASTTGQSAILSAAPAAGSPLLAGLTSAKALAIAGGIWLLGGTTGAALFGALRPQQLRVVYVERPVAPSSVATPPPALSTATTASTPAEPAPSSSAMDTRARRALPSAAAQSSELARERALLDLARHKAAHGEPAGVLELAERHRTQFPHGKLGEEREALAIRALLSIGRADEARTRARAFRLAHPHSILLPMIDSAMPAP
ncbi:MAG TPA: hypothetical protein VER12_00815 [Polyangiaceae bacterium]|nr:hypothetical protein [Polyangiaceae bacterium]